MTKEGKEVGKKGEREGKVKKGKGGRRERGRERIAPALGTTHRPINMPEMSRNFGRWD